MDQDRRRHLRKTPDKFAFVQIEGEEVGKVLNVSEGGLSFRSFAPAPQYGPLYFWFSFNLKDRIEGMGELAWTDSSRKVGGLRFVQLSKSSREQIHTWLSRLPSQQASDEVPLPRVVPKGKPEKIRASKFDRAAKFVSKANSHHFPLSLNNWGREDSNVRSPRGDSSASSHHSPVALLNADQGDPSAPSSNSPGVEASGGLIPFERYHLAIKRQFARGVLLGIVISATVTASAFEYWTHRRHAESTPVAPAESSLPKMDPPALPPAPQSESSPSPAVNVFSPDRQNKGMVPKPASSKQLAASYAYSQPSLKTWETKAANQAARTPGQPPLSDPPGAVKKSMTPAQLWGAVQGGNTRAAVVLAENYIQGEGVPKNCQQARILLLMASEKRNAAAIKRLHELDEDKNTCP
jgi:PilZ domain-containing protein